LATGAAGPGRMRGQRGGLGDAAGLGSRARGKPRAFVVEGKPVVVEGRWKVDGAV
jgi:hypothetical protein